MITVSARPATALLLNGLFSGLFSGCIQTPPPAPVTPTPPVSTDGGAGPPADMALPPATFTLWSQHPGIKIQPGTVPVAGSPAIAVEGPRDSWESHQIVIRPAGALAVSGIESTDLSDGSGHKIPASAVTFLRQVFVDFAGVTALPGNSPAPAKSPTKESKVPDALVPLVDPYTGQSTGAFTVAAGTNQPIWVDIHIPQGAAPGVYTATIRVSAQNSSPVSLPLSVTVWNLKLPDSRSVTTYFQMQSTGIIQFHKGTAACSGNCWLDWNAQARKVVKRYEELAHSHRIDVGPSFIPSVANGCNVPTGWDAWDAAMKPYMDGTYFADGVPITQFSTPFSPGVDWGLEACTAAQYTALAKAWATHLKAKGWFPRAYVFAADEPAPALYPKIAQYSQLMQAGDPAWKGQIFDTTFPTAETAATLDPALGIYVACLKCYDKWYLINETAYGRKEWPAQFAKGTKLWFYESNAQGAPYPTFASNTLDGVEPRMMMWGSFYEGATGFLFWQILGWDMKDPWGPTTAFGKTGDGMLVYPGHHDGQSAPKGSPADVAIDGPVPSYRLKMLRSGLQDWALFRLAEQKGLGAMVRTQMAQIYSQLGGCGWNNCKPMNGSFYWKSDHVAMEQIRKSVALAIIQAGSN
ncbi:MAG: DUF4091 domain-containing protein [Myxococcales bacterium]|nr:DUF4091 domain-containing protein [Myxococcales bacterium]